MLNNNNNFYELIFYDILFNQNNKEILYDIYSEFISRIYSEN